jgi:hypothetical protein
MSTRAGMPEWRITMKSNVQGFEVEVTVKDAFPHVRVSNAKSGELVVDTEALSVKGMENMALAFSSAARMAYNELDRYWAIQWQELRRQEALTAAEAAHAGTNN